MASNNTNNGNKNGAANGATNAATPPPIFGHGGPGAPPSGKPKERAKNTGATVFRLWTYLGRQRWSLVLIALMVVAGAGLDLLGPFLLGRAIDVYIIPRDLPGLARIAVWMLLVYASSSLLNWGQNFLTIGMAQRALRDIRADLFGALGRLPLRFFDTRSHGDLMSRLTNDVESINQVLSGSVTQIVSGLLSAVGIAVAMLLLNPILGAISLSTVALLTLVINRYTSQRTADLFRAQQKSLGALNGLVEETISGQRVVKAYAQGARVVEQFDKENAQLRHEATRAQTLASFRGPLMNGISNFSLAIVAAAGGALALRGAATVGTISIFINYTRAFGRPLNELANLYNSILSALAGAERVFEVMDETPETDAAMSGELPPLRGEVEFKNVTFSYVPGEPILKNISLHAAPGQTIALIGPTGAGKTTIINLLTRFYEIDSGRILIDGRDIREWPKSQLRQQLGIVLQDTVLWSGSIGDNIRYGRLDATDEEVEGAAQLANADAWIHRLPHGYNTQLSERGGNLSHGQRQMIAIARAILADPRILILDEATSSVDTRTEKHIQSAMQNLMRGRTSFVIAHRLSTIREADQILVIEAGQIIERGTHDDLMEKGGFYARMNGRDLSASTR